MFNRARCTTCFPDQAEATRIPLKTHQLLSRPVPTTREKLRAAEVDLRQLIAERDQLKTSVSHWAEAVTLRDERLKKDTAQTRRLADELNVSILKFNALATDHNATVKDLNDLRARTQKSQQ